MCRVRFFLKLGVKGLAFVGLAFGVLSYVHPFSER